MKRVVKDRKELNQIIANKDYLGNLDITAVTDLSYLFSYNKDFNIKEVEKWDFSKVEYMSYMFWGCAQLQEVTLKDTSNVESMDNMFWGCDRLEKVTLGDASKVISMDFMFKDCFNLESLEPFLPLSKAITDWSKYPKLVENYYEKYPEVFL